MNILKNGYYILFTPLIIYPLTRHNTLIAATIFLKLFQANYFFWYYPKFDYFPNIRALNQMKQMVRFTDTGHLASILVFSEPSQKYIPIAFNIHFAITFGYWIAKVALKFDDADNSNGPEYSMPFDRFWGGLVHSIPLAILLQKILTPKTIDECPDYFTPIDLTLSCAWLWVWCFGIYIPWRVRTGDPVYAFLHWNKSRIVQIASVVLMHGLLAVSNIAGRYIVESL